MVDADASARGRVIEVTQEEAAVLDQFEGPEYERTGVRAPLTMASRSTAGCGSSTGSSQRLATPGDWSFERFLAHDVDPFLGGSTAGGTHPGAGP